MKLFLLMLPSIFMESCFLAEKRIKRLKCIHVMILVSMFFTIQGYGFEDIMISQATARDANSSTGNDPRGIGGSGNGKLPFPGERGIFSLFLGFRVGESGE